LTTRRRRHFSSSAPRRRTDWARQSGAITLESGDYTIVNLLTEYAADGGNTAGVTVARTHLTLSVTSDISAGDDFYWGLQAAPQSMVGTNLAGASTPFEDPYADWAMWQHKVASLDVLSTTGYGHYWGPSNNHDYDIRAKRRLEQIQMGFLLAVEVETVAATTMVINYQASVLLMLP